jgi:uncharacterized lipoprotein
MFKLVIRVVCVGVFAAGLGACSLFGGRSDYEDARETRPLEIPPGLDTPATNATMTVPNVAGSPAGAADGLPQGEVGAVDGGIVVADGVSAAFRRVGLALERSGVAEIVARDEAGATYTVSGPATTQRKDERGFFSRLFIPVDEKESVTLTRVVRIVAEGEGSVVRIEDQDGQAAGDDLARRVIAALRERLN